MSSNPEDIGYLLREYLELVVHHLCFGAVEMDTPLNRRDVDT